MFIYQIFNWQSFLKQNERELFLKRIFTVKKSGSRSFSAKLLIARSLYDIFHGEFTYKFFSFWSLNSFDQNYGLTPKTTYVTYARNDYSKRVESNHTYYFWYLYAFRFILISWHPYSYSKFEGLILNNTHYVVDFESP